MLKLHPKKIAKNLLSFLLALFVVSQFLDFLHRPELPEEFNSTVLYDLQQQPFFLGQLSQDQPMILYFWGNWCHYCDYTSPAIEQLHQENIPVVSIALRSGRATEVQNYLDEKQFHFRTVNDVFGMLSEEWNVTVTPSILILVNGKLYSSTHGLTSYWGIKLRWLFAKWLN